jgi:hypothetical protein
METPMRQLLIPSFLILVIVPAFAQSLAVKIINRQDNETDYSYVVPGYWTSNSNASVNCFGTTNTVNCNGQARTAGLSTPAQQVSFHVRGATLSVQLPDGRVAVVNCESKFAERLAGPRGNHRSCRVPLVDDIDAEFKGDKAKLFWPVSIDGRKLQSETYTILGVLSQPKSAAAAPLVTKPSASVSETPDSSARRIWSSGVLLGATITNQLIANSPEVHTDQKVFALKQGQTVYLIASPDDLNREEPDILFAVEGRKVFLLGDQQHEAALLKSVTRQQ